MESSPGHDAEPTPQTVTDLLGQMRKGQPEAIDRLLPLVYDELRQMAHLKLRYERRNHTLNTTALVHEAYLKLADQQWANVQDRVHFFALAAQAMRRILVSYARQHNAVKRSGWAVQGPLDEAHDASLPVHPPINTHDLIALNNALTRLAFNERGCRVVEYRIFAGMMGFSAIALRRAWSPARMWLQREMS